MTAIEEVLLEVTTYILFSLKFSSVLSESSVVKNHLTDYLLGKKKSVDKYFLNVWYSTTNIQFNLLGIHVFFVLILHWRKKKRISRTFFLLLLFLFLMGWEGEPGGDISHPRMAKVGGEIGAQASISK